LIRLQLDLALELAFVEALRQLDDFRDRRVAADRDRDLPRLRPGALHGAAYRLPDRLRVDDRLLVDRVRRRRLRSVRLDPVATTVLDQLDQLDRGSGYVKSQKRPLFASREHKISFPTQQVGLES